MRTADRDGGARKVRITMSRMSKRRTKKVGLPAGSLVYTGEQAVGKVEVTLID
jgi:hypothetical protein